MVRPKTRHSKPKINRLMEMKHFNLMDPKYENLVQL